jgi:hypothetical protein
VENYSTAWDEEQQVWQVTAKLGGPLKVIKMIGVYITFRCQVVDELDIVAN